MEVKQLLNFRINQESAEESVGKFLEIVQPNWTKEKYQIKSISDGISSLTFRCFEDPNEEDSIAVRTRYLLEDFPLTDHALEIKVIKKMSELEYFPKLVAIFENGYSYQFSKGRSIFGFPNKALKINELQLRLLAKKLADIHSVKIEGEDYSQSRYFSNLKRVLEERYPRDCKEIPPYEDLKRELDFIEDKALRLNVPIVQCHGDAHFSNTIWNEENQSVLFIDWELSHVGFQAYDIAYMSIIMDFKDFTPEFPMECPDDYMQILIQSYLERFFENSGKSSSSLTEADVAILTDQVTIFKLVCNLYSPIFIASLAFHKFANNEKPQKISRALKFCNDFFDDYKRRKEEILQSKRRHLLH